MRQRLRWLATTLLLVSGGAPAAALHCGARAETLRLDLPASLSLPADAGEALLLVEEGGDDVLLRRTQAAQTVQWDLPPSGWAYQAAWVDAAAAAPARWSLHAASSGLTSARVRLRLVCADALTVAETTALRLLAHAGSEFARAEDAQQAAAERIQARTQAVDLLSAVAEAAATGPLRQRWPWLAPQALQARAFALGRMSQPRAARIDLLAAAAAWKAAGDPLRSAIAQHRAAQQWRREGDLDATEKLLRRLRLDPVVRADASLAGMVTNDYCLTLRQLLRLQETPACYAEAIALHERSGNGVEAALSRANRADAYAQLGRNAEADAEIQAARLQAQHTGRPRVQLVAALVAGNVARTQGRMDGAIRAYLDALALSESLQDPSLRANALRQIGTAYLLLGDFSRAQQFLGDAASAYEAGGYWINAVFALRNLADAQRGAGLPQQAGATIARALGIVDAGRAGSAAAAEIHLLRAELALDHRDAAPLDEAIAAAQSALGSAPSYLHRQRLTVALARRALQRDALPDAARWLNEANRTALRANDALQRVELGQLRAQLAQRRGDATAARRHYADSLQQALHIASLQSYPLHRASYLRQARRSLEQLLQLSQAGDAAAVAQRLGWIAQLHEAALSGERPAPAADERGAVTLALVNEQVRRRWGIQATGEELDRPLAPVPPSLFARAQQIGGADRDGGGTRHDPALPRIDAWEQYLEGEDLLLATFVGEQAVFSWTVRRNRIEEWRGTGAAELTAVAAALRRGLQDTQAAPVWAQATAVRAALGIGALRPAADARHYVLADGPLAELPPLFLLQPSAAAEDGVRPPVPATIQIASLQRPLAARADCCRGRALQAFADPSVAQAAATARSAAALPRLPGSRNEARAIAARWNEPPARIWLGAAFTRSRALQALTEPGSLVHFATHGLVSRDEPGLSALLVAADEARDGLDVISFHDLLGSAVAARLVVLGACDAGGGAGQPSGGSSLAHALLDAGAVEVVAPLWAVDDAVGTAFMDAFYAALADGAAPAAALARAQSTLAARPATAHPLHWAGFVLHASARRP